MIRKIPKLKMKMLGDLTGLYIKQVFNTINVVAKNLAVLRIFQPKDLSHAVLE